MVVAKHIVALLALATAALVGCGADPGDVWCADCDAAEPDPAEPSVRVTPPGSTAEYPPESFDLFGARYCQSSMDVSNTTFVGGGVLGVSSSGGLSFDFRAGDSPENDRLLVGLNVTAGTTGTHLFELSGPNDRGAFDSASSIDYIYGPDVDETVGGRPNSVLYLGPGNRGPTDNYDFAVFTFIGDDHVRMYDRQTMGVGTDAASSDALISVVKEATVNGGVLEEAPTEGHLLSGVRDRTTGEILLSSFDIEGAAFESNAVSLAACCDVPTGATLGDLARLPNGDYLGSLRDTENPGLMRFSVDDTGATLVVTNFVFEDFDEVNGLAVGRAMYGAPTIYASTLDATTGEVGMVTLLPVTYGSDCSGL